MSIEGKVLKFTSVVAMTALFLDSSSLEVRAKNDFVNTAKDSTKNLVLDGAVDFACDTTDKSDTYQEEKPPVPLSNGNYDFWSIAKISLEEDPDTCKMGYRNTVQPGEIGYVYGIENEDSTLPYEVEGYEFVQETQIGGAGVSIFEYFPLPSTTTP